MAATNKNQDLKKSISLEEAFVLLEEKIKQLEDENVSLENSFEIYKEGMDLLKLCHDEIDTVEKKVLKINESGEADEF